MSGGVAQRRGAWGWWACSLLVVVVLAALFVRPIGSGTRTVQFSGGIAPGIRIGTMDHFVMFPTGGNASMTFDRGETRILAPLKFTGKAGSWGSMAIITGSPSFTRIWLFVF